MKRIVVNSDYYNISCELLRLDIYTNMLNLAVSSLHFICFWMSTLISTTAAGDETGARNRMKSIILSYIKACHE